MITASIGNRVVRLITQYVTTVIEATGIKDWYIQTLSRVDSHCIAYVSDRAGYSVKSGGPIVRLPQESLCQLPPRLR